jgi:hypothetical protein
MRALIALGTFAISAGVLSAQSPSVGDAGAVAGTVLVAATGQPLPGAVVVLEAASDAAIVTPAEGPFIGRSRVVVTDVDGTYRFANLVPGSYRLLVRHLGYYPAIVDVDLARAAPFRISVGLVVNPIRLEPIDARALTADPYGRGRSAEDELRWGRLDAEQFRDKQFLEGDVTVLTHSDVTESVTLGETDLFRAAQRLPGVSTRDDFTAALWTRGAPWSQTRVYYDGQPLFNPVHAIGVFAGLNPDAVGSASFHPGVRSSAIGEGAAGVLSVTSRRAAQPGWRGMAELSVISAHGAAEWASPGGRVGAVVAARRSYVDLVTRLAESLGADSGTYIPFAFYDLTGRFDADLGRGFGLEASGLWEEDGVHGEVPNLLSDTRGHWGNGVGRLSLLMPLGSLRVRHTVGASSFTGTTSRLRPVVTGDTTGLFVPTHAPMQNGVSVVSVGTEVSPANASAGPSWAVGARFEIQRQHYAGQYPRPYPVVVLPNTLAIRERFAVASLWGERRWALGRFAALEAGLRVEGHERVRNAPPLAFAPKLTARVTPPFTGITLTAAAERSWQYTQALAPAGPSVGPDLYLTDVWLLAGDTIPAVRSDVATFGIESWLGAQWSVAANLFARRETGVTVPEPAPGTLNTSRPIFVAAKGRASGLELSARKLVGRWTGSIAYTYGVSRMDAVSGQNGLRYVYPSPADRRHVFDLTAMYRFGAATRVGAAFTAATGAAFSRFQLGVAPCDSTQFIICPPADSSALLIEGPNAARTPAYASLDLLLDWSHHLRTWTIGAYLQIRNALNLTNAVTYTGSVDQCTEPHPPTLVLVRAGLCDQFKRGVPILPLAGIRVTF